MSDARATPDAGRASAALRRAEHLLSPFIVCNLAFSTQAAYAAPLILQAQTRQADRDKARSQNVAERPTR